MVSFIPFEEYPNRIALDIVDYISTYIENKIVCDIGCGAGDLLEYIKHRNLAKEVKGIEITTERYIKERTYIQNGDVLKLGIPKADVYFLWLGGHFPYELLLKQMKEEKIIIYLDGFEEHHKLFNNYKGISLIETINFNFDEEKFVPENEFENWKKQLLIKAQIRYKQHPTHPQNWTPKGTRLCKIYRYTPN